MRYQTKQQRISKFNGTLKAAIKHLVSAQATLSDCNLYSSEQEEKIIDEKVASIEGLIGTLCSQFGFNLQEFTDDFDF